MEELLYMVLRGIIIGVVVSAPMGPVGIFCIQRTLDKGRLSGFYTGVGAAISDLIYCLLTGFGLSFIEEFINIHRSPIQLLGSIVLIFFGIWLIRKKPDGSLSAGIDHDSPSREGDILKGFALTFSNPLILFLIIGLFAQFNFVIEGIKFYHYLLGFLGIVAGALGWWWVVTFFVDKLRGHFNQRTMKLINTIVGVIILIFAAVGIFSSASTLLAARPSLFEQSAGKMNATFRVADSSMKGWNVVLSDSCGNGVGISVTPKSISEPFGDSRVDALFVRVQDLSTGAELGTANLTEGVDPYRGKNSWRITRIGNLWNIFAGNREYKHVLSFEAELSSHAVPEIVANSPGGISLSEYNVDVKTDERPVSYKTDIFLALEQASSNADGLEGVYSLLDYDFDDTYARIGGNYRVAVLPSVESGSFDVIYLDGATVNTSVWNEGMKKGLLKPTPFANIFDVEWNDAEGSLMNRDINAEYDPLAKTITIKFPYQNSTLRFRKE